MARPPLGLSVIGRDPSGAEIRWSVDDPDPGRRPQSLRFSNKRGEGFSEGGCTLARDIARDHLDMRLLNDMLVVGQTGQTAFEGRFAGRPGSADAGGSSISPALVGWMWNAKNNRRLREVYIDQDFGSWGEPGLNEKIHLATNTIDFGTLNWSTEGDGLVCALPNSAVPSKAMAEAWYRAPVGVAISGCMYKGTDTSVPGGYLAPRFLTSAADSTAAPSSTNAATFDSTLRTLTFGSAQRFVIVDLYANGTAATPASGANRRITELAVYGNHGLTTRPDGSDPAGLWLSDIIKDIGRRWVPQLSMAGVQENQTIVTQMTFKDAISAYDAWLDLNNLALWELAVWENKTLHYEPADLTDYDWEVRIGDPGVKVDLQGDTIDELWNGVEVSYDDVTTGRRELLTPLTNTELGDPDPDNPATQHGDQLWKPLELPFPATPGNALQFGRVKLAEALAPQGIGTIEVEGHVRDRAGHWQPAYMMRPGETVAVTNHPNDRPRLIVETEYDDPTKRVRCAVDTTFQILEAFFDRTAMAFAAANLSR